MKTNLNQWLSWLEQAHPKSIDLGLDRIGQVAESLQLKQFPIPVITVAGTNGKGSSVAMLTSIYQAAGYHTATYISPHLIDFRERVQIDGEMLSEKQWCDAMQTIDDVRGDVSLSYFEFTVLAGLLLIQQHQDQLDVIILEVGLGGRLDAINIIEPDVAVITTIELDHVDYLGDTRELIGREKAGIFRANKPAVCGDFDVPNSVKAYAQQLNATLYCQAKDFSYQEHDQAWTWKNQQIELVSLPRPALPLQNAATVLQAIDLLQHGLPVTKSAMVQGLQQARAPGRFHILDGEVKTILDVAHNPHAAKYLATRLRQLPHARCLAVMGMLNTKDIANTLLPLQSVVDAWYVAPLDNANTVTTATFAEHLTNAVSEHETITQAYQQALTDAQNDDIILVCGSFYAVSEIMRLLEVSV
tara:strand:+ start:125108 stop:126352 length:1245 start_codon:yes stop_codon:yes gene_type:complete